MKGGREKKTNKKAMETNSKGRDEGREGEICKAEY